MSSTPIWRGIGLIVSGAIGLAVLAWALFLIWYGSDLLGTGSAEESMGGFSFLAGGLLFLVPITVGFIYRLMKLRAPAKRSERPTEPEEVTFDADAAMERYLARKAMQDRAAAPPASPPPASAVASRPVFGRRVGRA